MNIVLCGLPMCGKSRFGKQASEKLGWEFIESDQLIEESYLQKTGRSLSCREIFKNEGEPFFRALESEQIVSLAHKKQCVISTGGGTLLNQNNVLQLKKIGVIIYLQAGIDALLKRLAEKTKPPAYLDPKNPSASFIELSEERKKNYQQICDVTIDTDLLTENDIVSTICKAAKYGNK